MQGTRILLMAGVAFVVAGCQHDEPLRPSFGNAVQNNNALMITDPNPPKAADLDLPLDGKRAASAVQRYHEGGVIQPEAEEIGDL